MAMVSNQNLKDLQWLLQTLKLEKISIYLSQRTSSHHQETENSMIINISMDKISDFSNIFHSMATLSSLKSLEFHHVIWDLQYSVNFVEFLKNSNVKQVLFKLNTFEAESLSNFCEHLKENRVIKKIVFVESCVGSFGATLLADVLMVNETIEELKILEDSIGSNGAEEISKMIEVNSTLRILTLLDSNPKVATPIISSVLGRNRPMEVYISSGDSKKSSMMVEFIPESRSLKIYQLELSGACRVAVSLGLNTTVKSLDLSGVRLKSWWTKEFRYVLEQNRTLEEVNLSRTHLKDKGVVYIAAGLFKNTTLRNLYLDGNRFSGVGLEHLLCPLSRFSTLQLQANITLKSVTIGGAKTKLGRQGIEAIMKMVETNETLTRFGIQDDAGLREGDFVKLFCSLRKNASLKYLSLQGCRGVQGENVLQALMETLQVNPWIEEIDLSRTPLQISGEADAVYQRLEENEKPETEPADIDFSKDMSLVQPKSFRVFLCGQEHAGKTTLCNSISQNFSSTRFPYIDQVRSLANPIEEVVTGIKIKTFKDSDKKISIWNVAARHGFYSLHDIIFPGHGTASSFMIISSLFNNKEPKAPEDIEEELQYWLRFIISNSRRAVQQCILPQVTIILTHLDKIDNLSQNMKQTVSLIQRLRDKFNGHIELSPMVFTLDARSSASVSKLTHHIRTTSKNVSERVPRVYQLCNDVAAILSDWRSKNSNKPAIKWKEFAELCQVQVPTLRIRSRDNNNKNTVEKRRVAVASCLHHIGEVIYFDQLDFLILDFEWFCSEVLVQLMNLDFKRSNGFVSRNELLKILRGKVLENLEADDLIRIMLKIELCYEQEPSDSDQTFSFLIPSILEDGRRKPQRWKVSTDDSIFAGRHLECDESSRTFLTPDFFPRLQVNLHKRVMALKDRHGANYRLEKYLISINVNRIYIRVELGGQFGYYVDILACSTKNVTEAIRLIQQLIIPEIQSLGRGITLTESVMRPECIRNLTPPRHRETQCVSIQQLKQALLSGPAESMYDYQHTWDPVFESGKQILTPGFDLARDLLSDDDFRDVLCRRYNDLYNLAAELEETPENNQVSTSDEQKKVEPSFEGIANGVEQVLQRLKIIEQGMNDLKNEVHGLRFYENRLLVELHRKINYILNYNIQTEERKVPNMLYFVKTENYTRRLITTVIPGMNACRLHMLCEFRQEIHVVEDQTGCEVMQIDNMTVKALAPYMTKFMKILTFSLKIGAHLATGMGQLIPDLSREIMHLADTSILTGAAGAATAGAVGVAVATGSRHQSRMAESSRNAEADLKAAQQWLVDFLRDRKCSTGKDIAEKFGLWRVRYRDDGQIAWICSRHMKTRTNEVIEVPI